MDMPIEEDKNLGAYDYNNEICQLPDLISHFSKEGQPVYFFQDPISGHIYFDICDKCDECWKRSYEDDYSPSKRSQKKSQIREYSSEAQDIPRYA